MKQIKVGVGVMTSNCGKQCDKLCNFYSFRLTSGWCSLFDQSLNRVNFDDLSSEYLRCEDCIDHEE